MEVQALTQNSETFSGFMNGVTSVTTSGSTLTGDFNQFTWPVNGSTVWYTPSYWATYPENKTEKAYQVIRALMRAKVVQIKTLNQFFSAMDEVVKAL